MNSSDAKFSPQPAASPCGQTDSHADAIAELYAELVAAWPRVEENRNNPRSSVVPYSGIIRLRTVAK